MSDEQNLEDRHPIKPDQSRAQATEYLGFMASQKFDLGNNETWELPNPQLMPPDMKMRYLEHQRFLVEDLDTEERQDPITKEVRKVPKFPARKGGKLINDEEMLCIALMGTDAVKDREAYLKNGTLPETYVKFLKAGHVPGQISTTWQVMAKQLEDRRRQDSKSS
ncbi:tail assembly chaperone [Mycobacterium phage QueenHazel]|uniref:Tail assembly chaperone n=1 Tax=Mycobacterium phage Babsiella TaxID=2902842 RepID=G8I6P8_9CAUD|nr:tail assembly chaperone [Mycobacterium phage Babsiella]AER48391.1 tail assembly chaperone [Mycobacterium phage Babsiella]QFG15022.1 tail assembly chaperone [Mycobacterium phage QueenHazel]